MQLLQLCVQFDIISHSSLSNVIFKRLQTLLTEGACCVPLHAMHHSKLQRALRDLPFMSLPAMSLPLAPDRCPTLVRAENVLYSNVTLCYAVGRLQALLEEGVPVIAFYFGLPEQQLLSRIQAAGAFTIGTATCLQEAQKLQEAGGLWFWYRRQQQSLHVSGKSIGMMAVAAGSRWAVKCQQWKQQQQTCIATVVACMLITSGGLWQYMYAVAVAVDARQQ
jgi:hypothetical protein